MISSSNFIARNFIRFRPNRTFLARSEYHTYLPIHIIIIIIIFRIFRNFFVVSECSCFFLTAIRSISRFSNSNDSAGQWAVHLCTSILETYNLFFRKQKNITLNRRFESTNDYNIKTQCNFNDIQVKFLSLHITIPKTGMKAILRVYLNAKFICNDGGRL